MTSSNNLKREWKMSKFAIDIQKKLEDMVQKMGGQMEQEVGKLSKQKDDQKADSMQMRGCIQEAVQITLKEDKDEELEQQKRKTSVIIHGIEESKEEDPKKRVEEDDVRLMQMVLDMKAEDIKATKVIRLGKKPENSTDKPRAMKVILENEEQKIKLLSMSKNLRSLKDEGWDKVFIHQDYTPRQQDRRKLLVKDMKDRQAQGEQNLIIVDWKIVRRRM